MAAVSPLYTSAAALDPREAVQRFRGHEVALYGRQARLEVTVSSTHADYQPHRQVATPASPPPPPRPAVPFAGQSSYSQDYVRHAVLAAPASPRPPPRPHVPFQGSSSTHDAFRGHAVQPGPASPPPPPRQAIPFQGSSTTQDTYRGHAVAPRRPSLGIATMGDRFHVLIPGGVPAPTSASQVFTTVHEGQREVCFLVYQGDAALASGNTLLGQFQLGPLPAAPAGSLKIQVTFYLDEEGCVSAEAQDVESGQHYQWRLQRQ